MANQSLTGGSFFSHVRSQQACAGAVLSELHHGAPRRLPAHAHALPLFSLVLAGDYNEAVGRRSSAYSPFTAYFLPAGVSHRDEIGPEGARFFSVELQPRLLDRLADEGQRLQQPRQDLHGGELVWRMASLYREQRQAVQHASVDSSGPGRGSDDGETVALESLLWELVGLVSNEAAGSRPRRPGWLARVEDRLHDEFDRPVTVESLADEAGVHRVHLARVFRHVVGLSIGDYLRRLRVQHACRLLVRPGARLADVSAASGFADQSHLTRIFKQVTGVTPAFFRTQLLTRHGG